MAGPGHSETGEGSEGSEDCLTCADLAVLADNVRGGQ